ncbi:prolyltRNA synthetase, mitochondrial [Mucor ambiguus]|uniref:ProlyltRNA synthetase, mitochondrial n=1 Tax=Mucor ambiguus TaxID=91626 RepID=A0A0C9MM17_9FUNG|nr:prolyltRNA synthetase, mitochondrial [Mucor ambiguus]
MLRAQRQPLLHFKRHFSLDGRNRLSNKFIPVTKDKPSNSADTSSHQILLKAGFVRQSGAGIYSLLPLGLRTVEKIERIIDTEMQAIGSEKLSLPMLLNPEGWKKTGRWDGSKGEATPTHEEEITQLVAAQLQSPKQLPIRLYQIGRKYRDELRPRAGLLRGREFIMKDLYSFDATQQDAYLAYDQVAKAYCAIFEKMGVPFVVAEADSGNIGGSKSHEYHLISPVGEDTLLTCDSCGYTANEELAVGKLDQQFKDNNTALTNLISMRNVDTTVVSYKATNAAEDGTVEGLAAIFTPPQRGANVLKVQTQLSKYLKSQSQMSERATMDMDVVPQAKVDNMDPTTISHLHVFVDDALNLSLQPSKQLTIHSQDHFRIAQEGDHCVSCADKNNKLSSVKAIECGHTFYLGTKYSSVLDCGFRESGKKGDKIPAEMGCYGIGITRLLAAVAEARYDAKGIAWPTSLAPYSICIVPTDDRKQEFKKMANQIYDQLSESFKGDVVIDDRRSGFGAKMKDAELVGYPYTIIVGPKSLQQEQPQLEIHQRIQHQESKKITIDLKDLQQDMFITA